MSRQRHTICSPTPVPIYTRFDIPKGKVPLYSIYSTARNLSSNNGNDTSDGAAAVKLTPGITIQTALNYAIQALERKSVPEPEESALNLLSHSLGLCWELGHQSVLANQPMSEEQCNAFQSLIERRIHLEPLQYIIGQWDFHDLIGLKIKEPMLCPRPETEELVEFVLKDVSELIRNRGSTKERIRILDVGSGTGAIGLAIANRYCDEVQVLALDVLPEAVELSNDNAKRFLANHIDDDFTNTQAGETYKMDFDIVVSNPPYIPSRDMATLSEDVSRYESDKALCGGDDGLDIVRHIVKRLPEWTTGNCWMEVDDSHPSLIADWLSPGSLESSRLGVECVSTHKDFCGRDRFVKLRVL
ncbi:hypothetical protein ACHAWT_010945 [Skeletonema menzelii]